MSNARVDDVRATNEKRMELQSIDEQLLNAVFAPAVKAGAFECGLPWRNHANREWHLLRQLLPLSEFYQQINPPLSTAIWAIWNTANQLRHKRSLLSMLFESSRSKEEFFVGLRALVASAVVQFADGTATTVFTSNASHNLSTYQWYAERAIQEITKVVSERKGCLQRSQQSR